MSVLVHGFLFIFSYAQVQEFLMAIPGSVFLSYRSYVSPTLLTMCQTACQNGYFILPLAMDKNHFPHIPSNTWYHQTLFFQQSNGWKWDFPSTWISLTITETEHLSYVDILLFELVFGLFSSLMLGTQEALWVLGNFLDLY